MKKYISLITLSVLISCGNNSSGDSNSKTENSIQEQTTEGSYRAILRPINSSLSGFLPSGVAEIDIEGDTIKVVTLLDDDARVYHMQHIQMGTRCPTGNDDTNGDGLMDIKETYAATSGPFIPLDSNLNSAPEGAGVFPMGGGYTYTRSASVSKLEEDVKAQFNQNLNLGGRVVVIHGVASGTKMPTTVATINGMTPQASIPIACGVLQRE